MLAVEWLGRVGYADALGIQQRRLAARRAGELPDALLLLEHPPVVTLGRSAKPGNLLQSREQLAARGVELHTAQRGGDVTYHAPGQLVGYAIVDLAARGAPDLHAFLRRIEACLMDACAKLGVPARRVPGMTGVFAGPGGAGAAGRRPRKLASIGIGVRHWISFHGFALNVDLDLAGFDLIVPCGLQGVEMSSLHRELGGAEAPCAAPPLAERARAAVADAFRSGLLEG